MNSSVEKVSINKRPRGINEKQLDVRPGVNSWVAGTFKRAVLPGMALCTVTLYKRL